MNNFAVLLAQPERHDVMALANALAAARKTPQQDQMIAARSAWGIVAENLSQVDAEALAAKLHPTFPCIALPADSMAVLPPATPQAAWEPGLAKDCILIAAAAIIVTSSTTRTIKEGPSATQQVLSVGILLTTGLPVKIGPKKQTIIKKQETSDYLYYLDLVYKNPMRRLRIDAQKFDYSALKERKLYNLLGNFKLILGDLVAGAHDATRNHGTRVLLSNQAVRTMDYGSFTQLERESRWLLTLQNLPPSSSK